MHSRGSHEERMPSTESGPSAELSTLCMMLRCTLQSVARWDACDDACAHGVSSTVSSLSSMSGSKPAPSRSSTSASIWWSAAVSSSGIDPGGRGA